MIKIIPNNLKEKSMPTDIRERLHVENDKGETELIIFYNQNDEITLTDTLDDNRYDSFFYSMNKEDWEEIKSFIDKQFKDAN